MTYFDGSVKLLALKQMYSFVFQAVFERLVDMICEKMSESLDADPNANSNKGTRLTDTAQPSNVNCNC